MLCSKYHDIKRLDVPLIKVQYAEQSVHTYILEYCVLKIQLYPVQKIMLYTVSTEVSSMQSYNILFTIQIQTLCLFFESFKAN